MGKEGRERRLNLPISEVGREGGGEGGRREEDGGGGREGGGARSLAWSWVLGSWISSVLDPGTTSYL